jgi:hypothetical protein
MQPDRQVRSTARKGAAFSVVRGDLSPPAAPDVAASMQRGAAGQSGRRVIDAANIRVARTDGETEMVVGAGSDQICLMITERDGSGSLGCTTPEVARDPKRPLVAVDYLSDDHWRVTALLPDSASTASLEVEGRVSRNAAVVSNVFTDIVRRPPDELRWTARDQREHRVALSPGPDNAVAPWD